jgi:cytochrome c-type biogenesis protein CcmE
MKPATARRLFLVGALLVAGGALAAISVGNMGENLVYYWDVSQLVDNRSRAVGATIRLGGMVKEGTVDWDPDANVLAFVITDGNREVPVRATGAPPQMFREGIGVVLEGTMTAGGEFTTDRLMVKHSNEYKAPDAEMTPEERKALYDDVLEGGG